MKPYTLFYDLVLKSTKMWLSFQIIKYRPIPDLAQQRKLNPKLGVKGLGTRAKVEGGFGERWGTIPNKLTPTPEHWGQSAHACRTLSATRVKSFSVNFIVTSLPCFPLKEMPMLARWTPLCFSFPSDFSPFVFFLRFLKNPFKRAFQVTNSFLPRSICCSLSAFVFNSTVYDFNLK